MLRDGLSVFARRPPLIDQLVAGGCELRVRRVGSLAEVVEVADVGVADVLDALDRRARFVLQARVDVGSAVIDVFDSGSAR